MGLTWDDFRKLAAVFTNLFDSIRYCQRSKINIKEKHRRIATASQKYKVITIWTIILLTTIFQEEEYRDGSHF